MFGGDPDLEVEEGKLMAKGQGREANRGRGEGRVGGWRIGDASLPSYTLSSSFDAGNEPGEKGKGETKRERMARFLHHTVRTQVSRKVAKKTNRVDLEDKVEREKKDLLFGDKHVAQLAIFPFPVGHTPTWANTKLASDWGPIIEFLGPSFPPYTPCNRPDQPNPLFTVLQNRARRQGRGPRGGLEARPHQG